jgi:hypothetical protein
MKPGNQGTERKRLARQIAEILAKPELPTDLYNAITDQLSFYSNFLDYHDPCVVEISLAASEAGREAEEVEIDEEKQAAVIG